MATMVLKKIRLLMLAAALALALVVGSISAVSDAQARAYYDWGLSYTKTLTSDDGRLVFVCYYDDYTGELIQCDVYYR